MKIFGVIGVVAILAFGVFMQAVGFNNRMISLEEMKKAELETTKVEYGQCVVKITETNQIATLHRDDVLALAGKAGDNLEQFSQSLMALVGTQVIPQLPADLRANVQREIVSCRNAYTARVDLSLKPMYVQFNRLQRQFPQSVYNSLFYHWETQELSMPKAEAAREVFDTGVIKPLELK
jgi:hypothetical protein